MPSNDMGRKGPVVIEHDPSWAMHEGLTYIVPKGFYIPLRGNTAKEGHSQAQSIYGKKQPLRHVPTYRNHKSYLKKHGDMSQKFELRSK